MDLKLGVIQHYKLYKVDIVSKIIPFKAESQWQNLDVSIIQSNKASCPSTHVEIKDEVLF